MNIVPHWENTICKSKNTPRLSLIKNNYSPSVTWVVKKNKKSKQSWAVCQPLPGFCWVSKHNRKKITIIEIYRRKRQFSGRHFVGQSCSCAETLVTSWHAAFCLVLFAWQLEPLRPPEVGPMWAPGCRAIGSSSHSNVLHEEVGGKSSTCCKQKQTHTQIPEIHSSVHAVYLNSSLHPGLPV